MIAIDIIIYGQDQLGVARRMLNHKPDIIHEDVKRWSLAIDIRSQACD